MWQHTLPFAQGCAVKQQSTLSESGHVFVSGMIHRSTWLELAQGVTEEMRDGAVTRTMRADSELPNVVGEVAFFLGIPQPRSWQVLSLRTLFFLKLIETSHVNNEHCNGLSHMSSA